MQKYYQAMTSSFQNLIKSYKKKCVLVENSIKGSQVGLSTILVKHICLNIQEKYLAGPQSPEIAVAHVF